MGYEERDEGEKNENSVEEVKEHHVTAEGISLRLYSR